MLPQEFETIEAEEVQASEQDVQPYFEHRLWSEYCFTTLNENFYMNVIEKKLVYDDCYMMKLTFFESEVTLPVEIDYIVTKDLYNTLKLTSLDCSSCDTIVYYIKRVFFRVMYTIFHSNSFENLIGCNCGAG